MKVQRDEVEGLLSDHYRLRAFFPATAGRLQVADAPITGAARWDRGDFWEEALRPVEPTMRYLAGTAA